MKSALSIAASVVIAAVGFAVAPSASAASGPLAGTWTSVDNDGSNQVLDISGSGNRAYSMAYTDDAATGACGGDPARISGPGFVEGEDLLMVGSIVCLPGGNGLRERISIFFDYDAGSDTLTDDFGIVWQRAD
jgi:hypothetical protein